MIRNRLVSNFSDFLHLKTIVELGSINRAALAANISQPALTRSVRRAEELLDVKLFERSAKGVVPTAACEALIEHLSLIDRELFDAQRTVESFRQEDLGKLRCGTTALPIRCLLPSVVSRIGGFDGLSIEIIEGDRDNLVERLSRNEIDLFIAPVEQQAGSEISCQFDLGDVTQQIFARSNHPLLSNNRCSRQGLEEATWVFPVVGTHQFRQSIEFLQMMNIEIPQHMICTSSWQMMLRLIFDNDCLMLAPRPLLMSEIESGAIVSVSGDWSDVQYHHGVYTSNKHKMRPVERSFLSRLQEASQLAMAT